VVDDGSLRVDNAVFQLEMWGCEHSGGQGGENSDLHHGFKKTRATNFAKNLRTVTWRGIEACMWRDCLLRGNHDKHSNANTHKTQGLYSMVTSVTSTGGSAVWFPDGEPSLTAACGGRAMSDTNFQNRLAPLTVCGFCLTAISLIFLQI
jgi:hypothetical protein